MYKKLNDLQFVIGLFFSIVSLILIVNLVLRSSSVLPINMYAGGAFLVFGVLMMVIRGKQSSKY